MVQITASMVKELREKTDAPMMECKNALTEANGDMARAEEILRVKLGNKASKAASRVTADGLIGIHLSDDQKQGSLVEVNCETDFVAKNEDFIGFIAELAALITANDPADLAGLADLPMGAGTVESTRTALVGKVGENVTIRRFQRFATENRLASYSHGGRIGVLVEHTGSDEIGKDVAMHVAAMRPQALDEAGVPASAIEAERSVARQKAIEEGKPENIVERIVEGTVQKYLKEVALLSQPFVKDDKQSVQQMLSANGAEVSRFALYVVGEGIERKSEDFAAEVAAAASSNV